MLELPVIPPIGKLKQYEVNLQNVFPSTRNSPNVSRSTNVKEDDMACKPKKEPKPPKK